VRKRISIVFLCFVLIIQLADYAALSAEKRDFLATPQSVSLSPQMVMGTTYSHRQSKYLEMDEKETYVSVLDLGFQRLRLAAYWDEIEKQADQYDFTTLDWQISEAKSKGMPLVLSVGIKSPRWPEFFIPDWVMRHTHAPYGAELTEKNPYLRQRALKFIETVVNRYEGERIIRYWQVENEPLDRSGANFWWIKKSFVEEEVALVRRLDDRDRPVLVTVATYPNAFVRWMFRLFSMNRPIPEIMECGDIVGLNVYHAIGQKFWRVKFYFWIHPEERLKYYSRIVHLAKLRNKELWITELQAEPWEPGELAYRGEERPPSGWPEHARVVFDEFRELGFRTVFFWGAEYWQYRKTRHQDAGWCEMFLGLLKEEPRDWGLRSEGGQMDGPGIFVS